MKLGSTSIGSDVLHSSWKPVGGDVKTTSAMVPGADRSYVYHDGRQPRGWEFVLQKYGATPEDSLDDLIAAFNAVVPGDTFYPFTDDRFVRLAVAGAAESSKNRQTPEYWSAQVNVLCESPYFFDDAAKTVFTPALNAKTSITPAGSVAAPLDALRVDGTYSVGSHLTDLAYIVYDASDVLLDSVDIADRLLSDERLDVDYKGKITQVYEDDFASSTRWTQDATNNGCTHGSGAITVGNECYFYYLLRGPWPLSRNLAISADIVISAGTPVLQHSFDGVNWETDYEGTELTATDEWIIPGTKGRSEVYTRFKSQSSNYATLTTAISGANNDVVYTAAKSGISGNNVTMTYVKPTVTTPLSVAVVGNDITVTLATSGSTCTTYCYTMMDLLWSTPAVLALIGDIEPAPGNDTSGLMAAMPKTNLSGGTVNASMTVDNLRIEQERQIPVSDMPVLPLGGVARKVAIEASAGAATIAATYRDRFWI
jgi:hypothetical protein